MAARGNADSRLGAFAAGSPSQKRKRTLFEKGPPQELESLLGSWGALIPQASSLVMALARSFGRWGTLIPQVACCALLGAAQKWLGADGAVERFGGDMVLNAVVKEEVLAFECHFLM